jgi:hypothetical protein
MNLNDAIFQIDSTLERIKSLYGEPMFDEWLIIDFREAQGKALYYSGPRTNEFDIKFRADMEGFKGLFTDHDYQPGNFEFARLSVSTRYDAAVTIAPRVYLVLNHTSKGMFQIRQKKEWSQALLPFLELADKFQRDPLKLPN